VDARRPEISLGELPFTLSADELHRVGARILGDAEAHLEALLSAEGPPTVETLLAPLDRILSTVRDLGVHGSLIFAVHPDETVRSAGREVSEAADRFFNAFRVNDRVYRILGAIPLPGDDRETAFAVEKMRREMRRAGVELETSEREALLALSNRIDRTSNEFQENIARSSRSIRLAGPSELAGLPPDFVAGHPPAADGSVRITTRYPDFFPVLAHAEHADVRRRLLAEFMNTAYPENAPVLARLLGERHEFARALGYPNFAAFAIENKMLKTPAAVQELLDRVAALLRGPAQREYARFLERKRRDDPGATELYNWDATFLTEGFYDGKVRAEEFGVDSMRLRRYLPYGGVRDGLFRLCEELLGLSFERVDGAGLWHPSIEAFDVRRRGALLGRCYLDMVPREGKYNHAACFTVRGGFAGERLPQAALVCNFLPPDVPRESARLEYAQVTTFFHEFGHLLHALFAGQPRWLYHSMEFIEWDFVEAPSLLFEEWARDPATLRRFARDPDTGEGIPTEILDRLRAAEALGRSSKWLRQVALAASSLALYDRDPDHFDASELMRTTYGRYARIPLDSEYHPATGFGHLTGYSAYYYTYLWSLVIARDLLRPFLDRGSLTDPALAERYVVEILAPGSSRPAIDLVRSYLGREPGFDSFERWIREGIALSGSSPTASTAGG
jgi:thimet oligopeptidase